MKSSAKRTFFVLLAALFALQALSACGTTPPPAETQPVSTEPVITEDPAQVSARMEEIATCLSVPPVTQGDLYLPTDFGDGYTVAWKSDAPTVLSDAGELLTNDKQTVHLTATITHQNTKRPRNSPP